MIVQRTKTNKAVVTSKDATVQTAVIAFPQQGDYALSLGM